MVISAIVAFIVFIYALKILYLLIKVDFNVEAILVTLFIFFSPSFWMAGKFIANLILPVFDKMIGVITNTDFSKDEVSNEYFNFQKTHPHEFEEIIVNGKNTYEKYPDIFPDKTGFALRRFINKMRDHHGNLAYDLLKGLGALMRIYTIVGLVNYIKTGDKRGSD